MKRIAALASTAILVAEFALVVMVAVPTGALAEQGTNGAAIKEMIARFRTESEEDYRCYYLAIDLAKFKSEAVPFLIEGLKSPDAKTRKWCARTITNIVGGYQDYSGRHLVVTAGQPLLEALTREKDESAAWHMVQAVGVVQPDFSTAMPVLTNTLVRGSLNLKRETVDVLSDYKRAASPAKPLLIRMLQTERDTWLRRWIVNALQEIGLEKQDAQALSRLHFESLSEVAPSVFVALLPSEDEALQFLKSHPGLLDNLSFFESHSLANIFKDESGSRSPLAAYVATREDLPADVMVYLGDARFLAILKERIKKADPYSRIFLEAAARALGAPRGQVVKISEKQPGSFRPKSAWPGTDEKRWADGPGHGDGITPVLVTGRLLMPDGSPAVDPKFYNLNDRLLMGEKRKEPAELVRYDHKTGRFAFLTEVFAASSTGEGQKEPGPYQTGTAEVLIEAQHAKPLPVSFYDEMPDVDVSLSEATGDDLQPPKQPGAIKEVNPTNSYGIKLPQPTLPPD